MKKLFTSFLLLIVGIGLSWADNPVIINMKTLVDTQGATNTAVDFSGDNTTAYLFISNRDSKKNIKGIDNSTITNALEDGQKYVTVAAWIYGNTSTGCIFGYGDANNGVKFMMQGTGTTMRTTTKGKTDYETGTATLQPNEWNLVAFAFKRNVSSRYYWSTTNGTYTTVENTTYRMNTPADTGKKIAIGSGDQGADREGFNGIIANMVVIISFNSLIPAVVKVLP